MTATATLAPVPGADPDTVYEQFTAWAEGRGLTLYPAQDEAVLEWVSGQNVILATPTGSGKSLVATAAHFAALCNGQRSFYTAPIKALVSEKFFALIEVFGAENVGMMTGDATVNGSAPIICCTAEILANLALRQGADSDARVVVMDEFHFYADPDRGWAWQIPLLQLPKAQFLLMSATLGDVDFFADDLTRRTGRETAVVTSAERPVPLHFRYATTPLHETVTELLETREAPIYIVHFTQAAALEQAQALTSLRVATREERDRIADAIGGFRFNSGFGKVLSRVVRHGIGIHHAGMLPRYRRLVEQLAQQGLLKVICGTDTLGVGINVPIRTVVFAALSKYDGTRQRHLQVREFHQIAGRAGRAGFDTAGTVVVQAPEHEVENERLLKRAGDDEKKRKRIVRKKPPEGFVNWGKPTAERLERSAPEALSSRFAVTHGMVLNVVARPGDPCQAMRDLLTDNHEPPTARRRHVHEAIQIYRSLLAADVLERLETPDEQGRSVRLTVDLPLHFALNRPLSTFALAAVELLDPESDTFALDVVSVVEATLDDPRQVLSAQLSHARGEAVAAMKAEGIEYEERMELLTDVTYPRPLGELLEAAYSSYAKGHPWLLDHHLAPKSVVRDMWERAMTFGEYVRFYGLVRTEGSLLRYLSDAYRALRGGIPAAARTEAVEEIVDWLGELVHQVDSSLLEEWEALTDPADDEPGGGRPVVTPTRALSANTAVLRTMVRNALFRRVELAALRRVVDLELLDPGIDWQDALDGYFDEYDVIGTGPDARGPALLHIATEPDRWLVRQVFDDPEGDHDWAITAEVDLAATDEEGELVLRVTGVGPSTAA